MEPQRRGEYTPIQISFDLGSPIHREALFQVLLTMEQEEPEGPTLADVSEGECCGGENCGTLDSSEEDPVDTYGEIGDDPNG